MDKLSVLGFHPSDCTHALNECEGRLDDAALWLTHNAQPVPAPTVKLQDQGAMGAINFHAIEIKTGSVNICVIDDCGDCDVPLLETSLSHLGLKQVLCLVLRTSFFFLSLSSSNLKTVSSNLKQFE